MADIERAQALRSTYRPAQKFALYRIASIVNDLHGKRWWMKNETLAAEIGVTRQTVSTWMRDFVDDGWLRPLTDKHGGRSRPVEYVWTSSMAVPVDGESVGSPDSIKPESVGSPDSFQTESVGIPDSIDRESVGLSEESVGIPDTQGEREIRDKTERESNGHRLTPSVQLDTEFSNWWESVVWRKVGKGQARRAWRTARKKTDADTLTAAARTYGQSIRDPQYAKHPATWLNGECWEDETELRTGPAVAVCPDRTCRVEIDDRFIGRECVIGRTGDQCPNLRGEVISPCQTTRG